MNELQEELKILRLIIDSYHIQFNAAKRATSLGLCKRVIMHALDDERDLFVKLATLKSNPHIQKMEIGIPHIEI